jgi:hypothetical protein
LRRSRVDLASRSRRFRISTSTGSNRLGSPTRSEWATPRSIVRRIYYPDHSLRSGMYVDVPHLDCLLVAAPITVTTSATSSRVSGLPSGITEVRRSLRPDLNFQRKHRHPTWA